MSFLLLPLPHTQPLEIEASIPSRRGRGREESIAVTVCFAQKESKREGKRETLSLSVAYKDIAAAAAGGANGEEGRKK